MLTLISRPLLQLSHTTWESSRPAANNCTMQQCQVMTGI